MEISTMEILQKVKNITTTLSSNSTAEYLSTGKGIIVSNKYLHPYVHCNIIYNSQDLEAT